MSLISSIIVINSLSSSRVCQASTPCAGAGINSWGDSASTCKSLRSSSRRSTPAAASIMASYCPSRSFLIRVGTFPRKSLISTSGLNAKSCALRRADEVPTCAAFFRLNLFCSSTASLRINKYSDGSSRFETPATIRPSGLSVGKSLCECTAKSMVLFSNASSNSFVKNPLPSSLSNEVFHC